MRISCALADRAWSGGTCLILPSYLQVGLGLLELMDGRGLVLLRGLSRLDIYPPSGANIRMVHAPERSESTPYRDAASFPTISFEHGVLDMLRITGRS